MADEENDPSVTGRLGPLDTITMAQAAEATRRSIGALATELFDNMREANLTHEEIMVSIAQGALAWSVDAYLRYWAAQGMPTSQIRATMNRHVTSFWKQSIEAHLRAKAILAEAQTATVQ